MNNEVDMVLVVPPHLNEPAPILGVSVLKSCLAAEGISSWVDYENIRFIDACPNVSNVYSYNLFDEVIEATFNKVAGINNSVTLEDVLDIYEISLKNKSNEVINREQCGKDLSEIILAADKWVEAATERILERRPKVVGCSSVFAQRNASIGLLRKIKEKNPDVVTVIGGWNVGGTAGTAILKEFGFIDYVFSGESDDIFGPVIKKIIEGDTDDLPEGVIRQGMNYPDKPVFHIVENMDLVPAPCFDDYFELIKTDLGQRYIEKASAIKDMIALTMESARGCWWGEKQQCNFCGVCGKAVKFRRKSPENFMEQLKKINTEYEHPCIWLTDPIMAIESINDVVEMMIEDEDNFSLYSEVKSNLTKDQIRKLAKAGFFILQPGIESFSDHFLKLINKGVSAIQNVSFIKSCKENSIDLKWNIITGAPGENAEDYQVQIDLIPKIMHLNHPLAYGEIIYTRDSKYYTQQERFGLKLIPKAEYRISCPENDNYINDIAMFYDDANAKPETDEIIRLRKTLYQVIRDWLLAGNGIVPILDMAVQNDKILIVDTRKCGKNVFCSLQGVKKDIYLIADEPVDEKTIVGKLSDSYDEDEIRSALKELLDDNLMLAMSGKYLSLAVKIDIGTFLSKYIFKVL